MPDRVPRRVRCTATTVRGTPCQAWAVRSSDPPRCQAHLSGSPEENAGLEKPERAEVDLDERIADLDRRIERLSKYIDECELGDGDEQICVADYARLVGLHGALCSRLSRMLRDRQQLQGDDQTELDAAIQDALDLAGTILGVEL